MGEGRRSIRLRAWGSDRGDAAGGHPACESPHQRAQVSVPATVRTTKPRRQLQLTRGVADQRGIDVGKGSRNRAARAAALPRRCVWCGRSAPQIKLTGEHVLRHWYQEHMGQPGSATAQAEGWFEESTGQWRSRQRAMDVNPWNVTVREVCSDCNTFVLNDRLEVPVQNVLLKMMRAEAVQLGPRDLELVATWAAKTAMMRSLQDAGTRAIPETHFRHLRDELLPPPFTLIWAAAARAPAPVWTRHVRFNIQPGPSADIYARCHSTTLALGELMLLVVGADSQLGYDFLQDAARALAGRAVKQLWPSPPKKLRWPPTAVLSSKDVVDCSTALPQRLGGA